MNRIVSLISAALVLSFLGGCASLKSKPEFHPLELEARQYITDVDAVVLVKEDGFMLPKGEKSNVSSATGGGILAAVVDVAINESREAKYKRLNEPMKIALATLDYAGIIRKEVEQQIGEIEWFELKKVEVHTLSHDWFLQPENKGLIGKLVGKSDASAVLIINPYNSLGNEYNELNTSIGGIMYPKSTSLLIFKEEETGEQSLRAGDNIFRHGFSEKIELKDIGDEEDNAEYIAGEGLEELKETMVKNVSKLIAQMVNELENPRVVVSEKND